MSFAQWTLVEVANAIRDRRVTSREVVETCLERIAEWQPSINAFTASRPLVLMRMVLSFTEREQDDRTTGLYGLDHFA